MSVKLIDNAAFFGYRVRRTIQGHQYQEYFSLKANGKRLAGNAKKAVETEAKKRDAELIQIQKQKKIDNKDVRCFREDGSIRGISLIQKQEKNGHVSPIFQVGIASELENKVICTSFSLRSHGHEKAWKKAVAVYAKHKKISQRSDLYQKLLDNMPDTSGIEVTVNSRAYSKKEQSVPTKKTSPKKTSQSAAPLPENAPDKSEKKKGRWNWF